MGGLASGAWLAIALGFACSSRSGELVLHVATSGPGEHAAALAAEELQQNGVALRLTRTPPDGQRFGSIPVLEASPAGWAALRLGARVFRLGPSEHAQGQLLAEHAYRRGHRRAAIVYILDDEGKETAAAFARAFTVRGAEVVLAVGHSSPTVLPGEDLSVVVSAMRRARPDVLLLATRLRELTALPGAAQLLSGPWPMLAGAAAGSLEEVGRLEGLTQVLAYPQAAAVLDFEERFRRRTGLSPHAPAHACYEAVTLLAAAFRQVGPDTASLAKHLDGLGRGVAAGTGLAGPVRFDESGDSIRERLLVRVNRGLWERLEP